MRKRMTLIPREFLTRHPDLAYMGEDVRCGGYYLVTEGYEAKNPDRIIDSPPPDKTSLLRMAMGFYHCGLTPIVEITYAN